MLLPLEVLILVDGGEAGYREEDSEALYSIRLVFCVSHFVYEREALKGRL